MSLMKMPKPTQNLLRATKLVLLVASLAIVAGCNRGGEVVTKSNRGKSKVAVGFVFSDLSSPWHVAQVEALKAKAKELGVTANFHQLTTLSNVDDRVDEIEKAVSDCESEHDDVVVAAFNDPYLGVQFRDFCENFKIKIASLDTRLIEQVVLDQSKPNEKADKYIDMLHFGVDYSGIGDQSCAHLADVASKQGWNIAQARAVIVSDPNFPNAERVVQQLKQGFELAGLSPAGISVANPGSASGSISAGAVNGVFVVCMNPETASSVLANAQGKVIGMSINMGSNVSLFAQNQSPAWVGDLVYTPEESAAGLMDTLNTWVRQDVRPGTAPRFNQGTFVTKENLDDSVTKLHLTK